MKTHRNPILLLTVLITLLVTLIIPILVTQADSADRIPSLESNQSADTIEVFLKSGTQLDEDFLALAHEAGFTLIFYHMDALEQLSKAINQNATRVLQPSIDELKNTLITDDTKIYASLTNDERTQLVIHNYEKHHGDIQQLKNTLIPPELREKYKRAWEDQQYASEHGITQNDLPALLFNNTVYKHTLDIESLLDQIDADRSR